MIKDTTHNIDKYLFQERVINITMITLINYNDEFVAAAKCS